MGIFDFLFGGGGSQQVESSSTSKVEIPKQLQGAYGSWGKMLESLAKVDPNTSVAGFSPDQLASYQALRDIATTDPTGFFAKNQGLFDQALGTTAMNPTTAEGTGALSSLLGSDNPELAQAFQTLLGGANAPEIDADMYRQGVTADQVNAPDYTTQGIQALMDPYQQQVIDRFNENFNRQADISRAGSARERAARRAFGSRGALAEGEEDRNIQDVYGSQIADLLSSGFTNAQGQFNQLAGQSLTAQQANQGANLQGALAGLEAGLRGDQSNQAAALDAARIGQAGAQSAGALSLDALKNRGDLAGTLASLGLDQSKLGLQGVQTAAGLNTGERATAIGNAALLGDVGSAYESKQQQQLDAPWTLANRIGGALSGAPVGTSMTTTQNQPGPSILSQLGGLGLAAYGLFGQKDGGMVDGAKAMAHRAGALSGYQDGGVVGLEPRLSHIPTPQLRALMSDPRLPPDALPLLVQEIEAREAMALDPAGPRYAPRVGATAGSEFSTPPAGYGEMRRLADEEAPSGPSSILPPEYTIPIIARDAEGRASEPGAPVAAGSSLGALAGQAIGDYRAGLPAPPASSPIPVSGGYPRGGALAGPEPLYAPEQTPAIPPPATEAPVAAPGALGAGLPFLEPGGLIGTVQAQLAQTSPAAIPPSAPAASPGGSPLSPAPSGGEPPFIPPIPPRPPSRGESDVASAEGDGTSWRDRFYDPLVQIGLRLMASRNPNFLSALGEAGAGAIQTISDREEQLRQAGLDEREMAIDEAKLDLAEREFAMRQAAMMQAARGGGRGGGGGGLSQADMHALDMAVQEHFGPGVRFRDLNADAQKAFLYMVGGERYQDAFNRAAGDPGYTARGTSFSDITSLAEQLINSGEALDWNEAMARARQLADPAAAPASGFGGLGGLSFTPVVSAPPPGFVMVQ